MAHQLEPLAFPAGQRVDRLPQPHITQPDLLQESQTGRRPRRVARFAKAVQEFDGFIHRRFQQIRDVPTGAPGRLRHDLENVRPVAAPVAIRATDKDIA